MPVVPGWSVAHSYRTANEVGGDYYDLMRLPDGRVALIVGDASGHGMAAGLVMAIANTTLKTALDLDPAPERVAALLNRAIYRIGTRRTFMSIFYAVLDPVTGNLRYVCVGHPFPFVRREDGRIEELGRRFDQRVQELIETPVALVSTSPEREDTILVRDPFVD